MDNARLKKIIHSQCHLGGTKMTRIFFDTIRGNKGDKNALFTFGLREKNGLFFS
jgi:hypothetical protein